MAKVGSLAFDLYPAMATDFRRVSIADFSAARSLPAAGSICPALFDSGCCRIGFAIAVVGSAVVVAAADFDPCPSCFAIVPVDLGSVGRRFVSGLVSFAAAEVAASVSVSDAVSIARFSFSLPPSWLSPLHSSDSVAKWIRNAKPHRSDPLV